MENEQELDKFIQHEGVQDLLRKGKQKDLKVYCEVNDSGYLSVRCNLDVVEYGKIRRL